MSTTVVNLRRKEAFDVYGGRTGPFMPPGLSVERGGDGLFGNPIHVGERCGVCHDIHPYAGGTIPCFRVYFLHRVETDAAFRARVLALRGLRVACFCTPSPCHLRVLTEWVDAQPCANVNTDPLAGAPARETDATEKKDIPCP